MYDPMLFLGNQLIKNHTPSKVNFWHDMSQPHFHNSMSNAHLFPNHCNFQEILQLASQLQSRSCSERTYRSKSKMISSI